MTLRGRLKYRLCSIIGSFVYFGFRVYFPSGSWAFRAVCEHGIFEAENVRLLQGLSREGSHIFDVGAHLGMMAIPLLATMRDVHVVSYEPSPNALPWLRRTVSEARRGERWRLVEKAVGAAAGVSEFSVSHTSRGMFDGLEHTRRVPEKGRVSVEVTTLDEQWRRLGSPEVSMIKIDVEGAELAVLRGARDCLAHCRPFVLLEWNQANLAPYALTRNDILAFAQLAGYGLYAVPGMVPVRSTTELRLHQCIGETFLLAPENS